MLQFPTVCDYHDANYTVHVKDELGTIVNDINSNYDKDSPENVEVAINTGLEKDRVYTATIIVTTVVNSTAAEFKFGEW